ncbi:concanavalin A-like lectin/glucanase domain-containing protein [Xylaria palmicola]|nr:concanavalin A-like lectin/glucanase domain-containing protein [Xylaria palmicola]
MYHWPLTNSWCRQHHRVKLCKNQQASSSLSSSHFQNFSKPFWPPGSRLHSKTMPPTLEGFTPYWWNDFQGDEGSFPDQNKWEIVERGPNDGNREVQTFTQDTNVVALDGEKLVIKPQCDDDQWTSARLHCTENFHAGDGRIMIIQADMVVGGAPAENQSGIWPSFWLLGKSYRDGGDEEWPMCGEVDIFENASGKSYSIPAIHFGSSADNHAMLGGGPHRVEFDRDESHTWSVVIDRKNSGGNWEDEKIQFLVDGEQYYEVSGSDMGDEERWASVAHQAVFPIIQVAVGNNWSGGSQPNSDTATGPDVGLALKYVAVYFDS